MRSVSLFGVFACAVSSVVSGAVSGLPAVPPDAGLARGQAALTRLPLRFEANRGQWGPSVQFAARGGGYDLLFTGQGPSLRFGRSQAIDISLVNGNPQPVIEGLDALKLRTNYMIGARAKWHTDVPNYARVEYRQAYPGIDVIYYGSHNQLEYDFVLAPGADPGAIRMRFSGAGRLRVTREGDLVLESPSGRITQKRPLIYQEMTYQETTYRDGAGGRREIGGRYVLLGRDTVGLKVDGYDKRRKLVIDPILAYSTYLGGTGQDQINAVHLAPNGHLYMVGQTATQDIPAINGAYDNDNFGLVDIFLAIVDTTQTGGDQLIYFSYLGGSSNDIPLAVAVDANGVAYMTGTTTSTDFPMAGNSLQTLGPDVVTEAFIAVIDPSQYGGVALIYSTFLGGQTGANSGNAIAVDSSGNIYVAGTTASSDFPVTASGYATVLYGPSDAFLTEISENNSTAPLYSSYLGGENDDDGRAMVLLPNGQVYVGISTDGLMFPLAGYSYNPNNSGGYDVAIALFDTTQTGVASLVYSTYIGGSANDMVRGMTLDNAGNLVVTGYTLSPNFPVTADAAQHSYGGGGDAFVTVVNALTPTTFLNYSTFFGGSDGDVAYAVAADSAGFIYLTGYTLSPDFPITQNAPQPVWGQGIDIFLTKLQPHVSGRAALQYSTYFGGATVNTGLAIAVDSNFTAYAAGWTGGELPTQPNSTQGAYGGGPSDGFLLVVTK
jgi:Beta-propeller repeat